MFIRLGRWVGELERFATIIWNGRPGVLSYTPRAARHRRRSSGLSYGVMTIKPGVEQLTVTGVCDQGKSHLAFATRTRLSSVVWRVHSSCAADVISGGASSGVVGCFPSSVAMTISGLLLARIGTALECWGTICRSGGKMPLTKLSMNGVPTRRRVTR